MSIIIIVFKILATIAVLYLAKDSSLLPLRCVDDDDVMSKWRIECLKLVVISIFVIIIIWIK